MIIYNETNFLRKESLNKTTLLEKGLTQKKVKSKSIFIKIEYNLK